MSKLKFFLKKILTHFPLLNKIIRNIYNYHRDVTYFMPLEKNISAEENINKKLYRLNLKNFNKLKIDNEYFLIFKEKSIKNYSADKLNKIKDLVLKRNADVAYDGDDQFNTEITSRKVVEFYLNNFPIEKYPHRFFYINEKFNIRNIGSMHRSYNFNATFNLPSGGRSIGDGGPVENRLKYIPDLTGKTFLDIGSEEGYAVFEAINKNSKFAKGLNINGEPWKIGIEKPVDNSFAAEHTFQNIIELNNKSLATSGNYRKFKIINGQKVAHSINPKTGYPAKNSLLSVTVISDKAAEADVLATAFMVMGKEETISYIKTHSKDSILCYMVYDSINNYKEWSNF